MAIVHARNRVAAPIQPDRQRLRDEFFGAIGCLTLGLVRGERWRLALGPLTLIRFGPPSYVDGTWSWPIGGGLLTRGPGGRLSYGWRDGELIGAVDGYRPLLPGPLHRLLQAPVHHVITRLFLLRLRGPLPRAGVAAGSGRRLTTACLDLALCAGVVAALLPSPSRRGRWPVRAGGGRRRLAAFALVAAAYHVGFWSAGGRTPAAWLTGQRLVALDGSPVEPAQAAIRLAMLPFAARALRPLHDAAAATEVIEAGS